jgi:hypothetical protein
MADAPKKARRKRGERAAEMEEAAHLVGRAFRCPDGLVRWITYLSTLGNYGVRWLDERDNTWCSGGTVSIRKWREWYGGAEEVRAPQPGEKYQMVGATGMVDERVVEASEAA